jgi:hypothetical protein
VCHQWKPSITLLTGKYASPLTFPVTRAQNHTLVLAVIQEKLNNPSPDDPYDADIAAVSSFDLFHVRNSLDIVLQLLRTDKAKFLATAKEYTKK